MKSDQLLIELINYYSEWIETVERPEIFLMHRLADRLIEAQDKTEFYKKLYEYEVKRRSEHRCMACIQEK